LRITRLSDDKKWGGILRFAPNFITVDDFA